MTYYQELLQSCPPPPSGSPFGKKQDGYDARLAQAKLLSQLMRKRRPFCFLRMGDMELAYLLAQQEQRLDGIDFRSAPGRWSKWNFGQFPDQGRFPAGAWQSPEQLPATVP